MPQQAVAKRRYQIDDSRNQFTTSSIRVVATLHGAGLVIHPYTFRGMTLAVARRPLEFARGLKAKNVDLYEGVVYVTELYNRARFGGWEPGKDELARVREILARMNTA